MLLLVDSQLSSSNVGLLLENNNVQDFHEIIKH